MPTQGRFVVLLLTLSSIGAGPLAAGSSTIPGVVNTSGLNGTRFASDLTVTNPGTGPVQATISFLPSSPLLSRSVTLNPGQTLVYRNAAEALFGASGVAGALSISADQPLLIRGRTYNTAASGTFGVALPVFEDDRLLTPGEAGDSLWVSQDGSGSSGYRTNIAVVFPDARGGAATVTVYDSDGNAHGSKDFALDAPGFQQSSVGSFAGAVPVGRARVAVTRGRAAGYAVVVDNITGDSSLFTFDDLPGGRQDVLANGVARANGRNGAFFRTDGRFYNPTDTDATVKVAFHASSTANPSPATASFTLPAGKIRDVVDVLDSLLGLPVGSAGALRFQSDWPVAILCRTSNVDPSGARQGTFGSQQKPVPILSFLTSADAGAAITGIRQDAAFRTNVGFAAGGDGARYSLTLSNASGGTIATASGSLGPWGWAQPGIQDLFPTASIPSDATLQVKVTEGSLDVFDSSIDNLSGDPVVTPIAPLPATIPSQATIGPQGGSIRSSDGRLTLRVPAGALSQPVTLSFQTTANNAPQGTGPGYQLSPSGTRFARPALLTLAYGRADTESSSAEALIIASRTGANWSILGGGTVDSGRHTLTVPLPATPSAAAARAQGRNAAADGSAEIAVAQSWVIAPSGLQIVMTRGQLPFSVRSVGGGGSSSSSLVDLLTGTLSTSPQDVAASWYVNDLLGGTEVRGKILSEQGTGVSAVYFAPACAPDDPVVIRANIQNRNGFNRRWYWASGAAWVRVVAREWKLMVDPTFTLNCVPARANEISDVVSWPEGMEVDFTLGDDFKAAGVFPLPKPSSHRWAGCPICPNGGSPILFWTGPDSRLIVVVYAEWNREADAMKLDLIVDYAGQDDLVARCDAGNSETKVLDDNFSINDKDDYPPRARVRLIVPTEDDVSNLEIRLQLLDVCR